MASGSDVTLSITRAAPSCFLPLSPAWGKGSVIADSGSPGSFLRPLCDPPSASLPAHLVRLTWWLTQGCVSDFHEESDTPVASAPHWAAGCAGSRGAESGAVEPAGHGQRPEGAEIGGRAGAAALLFVLSPQAVDRDHQLVPEHYEDEEKKEKHTAKRC